ncbi:putative cell surface spherulin 4-like protein [Poronia punctata]|nr:putative cell surface spherulin 4-like protein [Poronia punctata]
MVTPAAILATMTALSTSVSATGILLPLYVYPSADYDDGAANWQPALDAIKSSSSVSWLAVVNPDSGPGATGKPANDDVNYISGIEQLNAQANVRTIGYVRTNYGASPAAELEANITTYASWASSESNVGVKGIFFDETSPDSLDYLRSAVSHARSAFGDVDIVTICNFGAAAPADFYEDGLCDVNIIFENYLSAWEGTATLDANIPSGGSAERSAAIVHDFQGTDSDGTPADTALLKSDVQEAVSYGLGWVYFCSANYDSITATPATIGALAASF